MTPERDDAVLTAAYRKNPADEDFLTWLNTTLAGPERDRYDPACPEAWPTLHVLGAPRSGTTLTVQLVASELGVGTVGNLAAAFWAAPCAGLRLARKLLGARRSTLTSDFGRTDGLHEPHEFGYFWSSHLNYRTMSEPVDPAADPIDWADLGLVLRNMTAAWGGPLVFKSFVAGFYTAELVSVLPRSCFLLVTRDPVDVALSILDLRRRYSGDLSVWTSVRPREASWMSRLSPEEQAAGQALASEAAYHRALARVAPSHGLVLPYETLTAHPAEALERVADLLAAHGPLPDRPAPRPLSLVARRAEVQPETRRAMERTVDTIRRRMESP